MSKKSKRNRGVEKAVERIQQAALETYGENIIPTELTFQQALSIHIRSKQLRRESEAHPLDNPARKSKEIDICWNKRR